jgi:hypothetical protein
MSRPAATANRSSVTALEDADELDEMAIRAREQLEALWTSFLLGAPFTSLTRPEKIRYESPYHQLARVKEWRAADEAGDGMGDA